MGHITLNQSTWKSIGVTIRTGIVSLAREEADVVALGSHDDCELDVFNAARELLGQSFLDVLNLLIQDVEILTLRNTCSYVSFIVCN
jgi:hypothetical protein